jgi:hypothetical protein
VLSDCYGKPAQLLPESQPRGNPYELWTSIRRL